MNQPAAENSSAIVRDKAATLQLAGRMALRSLDGELTADQAAFCLPPSRSHILWLTGHLALSLDRMTALAIGGEMVVPESYMPLFGMGSQPQPDAAAYPSLAELKAALGKVLEAAASRILTLKDSDLARPLPETLPVARVFPTLGELLAGAVFHTSYHAGQIGLLRKAQGIPTGLGV